MAKTFISNVKSFYEGSKKASINAGFKLFSEVVGSDEYLIAFNKMRVGNENLVLFDTGYISVSGTFIYKDRIGSVGLELLYSDFGGDVAEVRKELVGNYLITIKSNGVIYVFGDENDIFNINYYVENGSWIISNDLLSIASQVSDSVVLNELNLIEQCFQNTILDNGTIFQQINRLKGSEYIEIDCKANSFIVKNIVGFFTRKDNRNIDFKACCKEFSQLLINNAESIKSNFQNITISMTGGLDSRVVLASYLAAGVKPKLVYGVGNSPLTNTNIEDLEINSILKNRFDLNFTRMNWDSIFPIDKYWDDYADKYGMLSTIYSASPNVNRSFEELKGTEFIDFGYFGEPLRNIDWIENMKEDYFTLDAYLDDFYINKSLKSFYDKEKYDDFREHLFQKISHICVRYGLDSGAIHKNDFQILHNEYRKGADTALLNFVNYSFYSINLLSVEEVETYVVNLDVMNKEKSKFTINVLHNIYPDIIDVPMFSHCNTYVVNKRKLYLERSFKTFSKDILRNFLNRLSSRGALLDKIKGVYEKGSSDGQDALATGNIKTFLAAEIKNLKKNYILEDQYFGDIRKLAKYLQVMRIVERLKR